MALGLSDEIQSSAGGIKLDTMFIDEGFGSLDEESLRQAVNTLAELSDGDRLIGIISHVGELKNRIDKQIVVAKIKAAEAAPKLSGNIKILLNTRIDSKESLYKKIPKSYEKMSNVYISLDFTFSLLYC